ncbi:MAG: MmgE/PrpD family protein [Chloroflexi bacterium]|nr:MmgE/PrpD family protein [Chloroflexota bacterium]
MTTEQVARFITNTSLDGVPPIVVAKAKIAVRDTIGVTIAGYRDEATAAVARMALGMGGPEQSTLLGLGIKVPSNLAALVNSFMASALDWDDGGTGPRGLLGHPGCVVVPSALAVAESEGCTGRELLEAILVGYEVVLITAWVIRETETPIPSWLRIGTGVSGAYGAAAAAAKLLKLSTAETRSTLGIAEAHCPLPPVQTSLDGTAMTKEAAGWGAMSGVTAALLAHAGLRGPRTLFDLPDYPSEPLQRLGREWGILGLYYKPYSCCRKSHSVLDGLFELLKEHHLKPGDIKKVTIITPHLQFGPPNYRPADTYEAQFSIPFVIGAAIVDGRVGPEQVATSRVSDRAILEMADKVVLAADPEVDNLVRPTRGGKVEIETVDGRTLSTIKMRPRGHPDEPLTEEELLDKFKEATQGVLGSESEALASCIETLEELESVNELIEKISPLPKR